MRRFPGSIILIYQISEILSSHCSSCHFTIFFQTGWILNHRWRCFRTYKSTNMLHKYEYNIRNVNIFVAYLKYKNTLHYRSFLEERCYGEGHYQHHARVFGNADLAYLYNYLSQMCTRDDHRRWFLHCRHIFYKSNN